MKDRAVLLNVNVNVYIPVAIIMCDCQQINISKTT